MQDPDRSRWKVLPTKLYFKEKPEDEEWHISAKTYGFWNVIYAWPPPGSVGTEPPQVLLDAPSKLESTMYSCKCNVAFYVRLAPIKIMYSNDYKPSEIFACELVTTEEDVVKGMSFNQCPCRPTILANKIVLYTVDEEYLILYVCYRNTRYDSKMPNHAYLLHRGFPSYAEIDYHLKGLEIWRSRPGGPTYRKNREDDREMPSSSGIKP